MGSRPKGGQWFLKMCPVQTIPVFRLHSTLWLWGVFWTRKHLKHFKKSSFKCQLDLYLDLKEKNSDPSGIYRWAQWWAFDFPLILGAASSSPWGYLPAPCEWIPWDAKLLVISRATTDPAPLCMVLEEWLQGHMIDITGAVAHLCLSDLYMGHYHINLFSPKVDSPKHSSGF